MDADGAGTTLTGDRRSDQRGTQPDTTGAAGQRAFRRSEAVLAYIARARWTTPSAQVDRAVVLVRPIAGVAADPGLREQDAPGVALLEVAVDPSDPAGARRSVVAAYRWVVAQRISHVELRPSDDEVSAIVSSAIDRLTFAHDLVA